MPRRTLTLSTTLRARSRFVLAALFVLALALRLAGIRFGLPHPDARPDERTVLLYALHIGGPDRSPAYFNYPSLFLTLNFVGSIAYYVASVVTGRLHGKADFLMEAAAAPDHMLLIGRLMSATLGALAVFPVYYLARRVGGRRAGWIAAALVAVAYLHVRDSHFDTVDVTTSLVVATCVAVCLAAERTNAPRRWLVAAFLAGLAASCKYNAALAVAPVAIAYLGTWWQAPAEGRRPFVPQAAGLVLASVVGFLVGTPYCLWDGKRFVEGIRSELHSKLGGEGWRDVDLGHGWSRHLDFSLWFGLGWPVLLAAIVGVVFAARRRPLAAAIVASFPFLWWLVVGASKAVFVRYAVPMVPFVCAFAAVGIDAVAARVARGVSPGRGAVRSVVASVLTLAVAALSIARSLAFDRLVARPDSRVEAAAWIDQHVPDGAPIAFTGYLTGAPRLFTTDEDYDAQARATGGTGALIVAERDYATKRGEKRHPLIPLEDAAPLDALKERPAYVLVQDYPLPCCGTVPESIPPRLAASYDEVYRVMPLPADGADRAFDGQDGFYAPFAGFDGVTQPGPNLRLYRLRDTARR